MIFVRSRRSTVLLAAVTAAVTLGLAAATVWAGLRVSEAAAVLLLVPTTFGLGFVLRAALRLRGRPRLGFFRDRLVVLHRRTELRASWDDMDVVTLAEANEWTAAHWPEVRLTDRLTIHMRGERPFSLRPRSFGLDPIACRDLVLMLRDQRAARDRLPEFDSALDLARRPVAAGEHMKPHI